jgi:hypothetical protein
MLIVVLLRSKIDKATIKLHWGKFSPLALTYRQHGRARILFDDPHRPEGARFNKALGLHAASPLEQSRRNNQHANAGKPTRLNAHPHH